MKSLQESLFDKDLMHKGVPMDVEAADEYVSSVIESYDFKKYSKYDSIARTYEIDRESRIFYLKLFGNVSYSETDKSHMHGLDRMFDYSVRIHFDQYEEGAVVNYVDVKFSSASQLQEEGFAIVPCNKIEKISIRSDNIKEVLDKYIGLFNEIEQYMYSNNFKIIAASGALDKPEWGLSKMLYNRRLTKYKTAIAGVMKELKNIAKDYMR